MTAPDDAGGAPDELDIEQRGERLLVSLKRADGWLIGRREVQKSDNCAETADVIAVVVASLRTNAAGKLPEGDAPAPVLEAEPVATAAPHAPHPPTSHSAPHPERLTLVHSATRAEPWAVAVSAIGVPTPSGPGFGAGLEVSWLSLSSRLGWCAGVSTQYGQHLSFATGSAHWERATLALGTRGRFASGAWFLDPRAELLASLLEVGGRGFSSNARVISLDPGLAAGMRSGFALGMFEPYVGAGLAWWAREQTLHVAGATESGSLPRLEFSLEFGIYL